MTARAPELLAMLERIERGEVTISPTDAPGDVYAGNVEYTTSTGHRIVVFNDCQSWDYVDSIFAPNGALLWDYPDGALRQWGDDVSKYGPSRDVAIRVYGFPS